MRFLVAEDTLPRPHEMAEHDAVRRGAGRDPHDLAIGLEQLGKGRIERLAERVAIIGRIDLVGGHQRVHHRRVDGRGIVGKETGRSHGSRLSAGGYALLTPHFFLRAAGTVRSVVGRRSMRQTGPASDTEPPSFRCFATLRSRRSA